MTPAGRLTCLACRHGRLKPPLAAGRCWLGCFCQPRPPAAQPAQAWPAGGHVQTSANGGPDSTRERLASQRTAKPAARTAPCVPCVQLPGLPAPAARRERSHRLWLRRAEGLERTRAGSTRSKPVDVCDARAGRCKPQPGAEEASQDARATAHQPAAAGLHGLALPLWARHRVGSAQPLLRAAVGPSVARRSSNTPCAGRWALRRGHADWGCVALQPGVPAPNLLLGGFAARSLLLVRHGDARPTWTAFTSAGVAQHSTASWWADIFTPDELTLTPCGGHAAVFVARHSSVFKLWDLATGAALEVQLPVNNGQHGLQNVLQDVVWSPCSSQLLCLCQFYALLYNSQGTLLSHLETSSCPGSGCWSGDVVAVTCCPKSVWEPFLSSAHGYARTA